MSSSSIEASAHFYGSAIGKVNAQIIGNSCSAINFEMVRKHGRFESAVFMGLGDGSLLEQIGPQFRQLTVLEAADLLVNQAREKHAGQAGLQIISTYFENYQPPAAQRAACILGNHILEHLDDPVAVLRSTLNWLQPDGIAIFTVPNATSLHRRAGVQMGMLKHVTVLSEQDHVVGHQRVYDAALLAQHVCAAGYTIIEAGGFNLKLVSQAQMVDWPATLHDAIYRVSRECLAEICSNLFVVCRPI
jgi:2-polyprenyl-3-methyl-5-hydroxy-6-metoxy-1,4-benzoquinol methylase